MDILWIQIVSPLKRRTPSLDSKANYKPMRKTPDGHMKIARSSCQYLEAYITLQERQIHHYILIYF